MIGRCAIAVVSATLVAISGTLVAVPARADADDRPAQEQRPQHRGAAVNAEQAIGADEVDGPTILEGLPGLERLDAARDALRDRYGFYLHGEYLGDPFRNVAGGLKRGATYSGRLDVELDVDGRKTVGLAGGTLHANLFQIHGRDLSRGDVGNFLSSNDIAALPTTRLYELWVEQKFGDRLSLRVGQQGIDVEFLTSSYGANFIDATFGWPGLPSENLPDGGPAYPLATPAVRAKFTPADGVAVLAAVFDGMPAGPCGTDPQACDRHGTNFRLSDPPLAIAEAQFRYPRGIGASGLPGQVKLGAFAHFGRFADQRQSSDQHQSTDQHPDAGDAPAGVAPVMHAPDGGFYGIIDQQVYRPAGDSDGADDDARGVGIFARAIGAPADRNPVDLYVDGGFSALGLVPGRPHDLFGAAAALARISPAARQADLDAAAAGVATPARSFEAVIEATYQLQVVPGLTLQPTLQYVVHPGGNVAAPGGLAPLRNAVIFGAATAVKF